jgi:hypothetical protein
MPEQTAERELPRRIDKSWTWPRLATGQLSAVKWPPGTDLLAEALAVRNKERMLVQKEVDTMNVTKQDLDSASVFSNLSIVL